MTGILDHPVLAMKDDGGLWFNNGKRLPLSRQYLEELKNEAIATNKEWAKKLGINQSAAITCVKPSGTVSQLVDSASWYTRYVLLIIIFAVSELIQP